MTTVAKQDVGELLNELTKSLYYCNELLLQSERLANYLPVSIEYPILLDSSITDVARRIVNQWKHLQSDYVFVQAHFNSDIVRGISYPVYLTRTEDITTDTIRKAIADDKLGEISGVQEIPDISFDDYSERIHEAIQMIIDGK